jgi:hypothetical protein
VTTAEVSSEQFDPKREMKWNAWLHGVEQKTFDVIGACDRCVSVAHPSRPDVFSNRTYDRFGNRLPEFSTGG